LQLFDWLPGNSALTFARPWLLLLLLAIPLLAWLRGKSGPAAALTYSSTASLRAIGRQSAAQAGKILRALLLLSLAFLVVALARPQLGNSLTQIEASGIDIVLVLDVSGSMLTKDFTIGGQEATRVDAIREVTRKFIEARPNDHRHHCVCRSPICREPDDAGSRLASAKFGSSKDRPRRRRHCDWIGHGSGC